MLVAQDPALDPRIDWSASFAGTEFDVTVIGIGEGERATAESRTSYTVRRCKLTFSPKNVATFAALLFMELSYLQRIAFCLLVPSLAAALLALIAGHRLVSRYGTLRTTLVIGANRLLPPAWRARRLRSFLFGLYRHFGPVTGAFLSAVESEARPDIVHCNDLDTLLVGVRLKKKYGCRVVYDAHEYWPYSDPCFAPLEKRFYILYERLLARQADHVITVNPLLARRFAADYELRNVTSIPNAVPLKDGRKRMCIDTCVQALAGARLKFLYLGGFAVHRGIEELLWTWKEVDARRAVLFLRGPDNAVRQEHQELADRLGLLDRSVYFLRAVDPDELIDSARSADIGVIPYRPTILNHVYSCPNKLSQYLQAGLMLLTDSNLLYVTQVVTESRAGILYDSNVAGSLLNAVNRILDDPALVRQCKTNAVYFADNHFNWDYFFGSLRDIYVRLAKG